MNKKSILSNTIGLIIAFVIIAAGVFFPIALLERQEASFLDDFQTITAHGSNLISSSESTNSSEITQDIKPGSKTLDPEQIEELAHCQEFSFVREPYENELTMEQATDFGGVMIKKFAQIEVLPNDFYDFTSQITGAVLYESEVVTEKNVISFGMWELNYKTSVADIRMLMEAETGVIYLFDIQRPSEHTSDDSYFYWSDYDTEKALSHYMKYYGWTFSSMDSSDNKKSSSAINDAGFIVKLETNTNSISLFIGTNE